MIKASVPAAVGTYMGGPGLGAMLAGGSLGLGYAGKIVSALSTNNRVKLAQAITMDARKKPLSIGLNTDNSDRSNRWFTDGMLPNVSSTVTYNGVDVDNI